MKESVVSSEIVKSLWLHGCWAHKLTDPNYQEIMRGARRRPFDIIAFAGDVGLGIEVKIIKKWQKFSHRNFYEHQLKNMDQIIERGGLAYVFLVVRISQPRVNRLIIFDWYKWGEIIKTTGLSRHRLAELEYCQGYKGKYRLCTFLKEFKELGNDHINLNPTL